MTQVLVALFLIFSQLSLLAFGGGNTIVPEMQRQVVEVERWMSAQEFTALFALAQAAPGPNLMIVPMIGWRVAGFAGLLVSSVSSFLPSSIVSVLAVRAWERYKDHPWRGAVQAGLLPTTVGLIAASGALLARSSVSTGDFGGDFHLQWGLALIVLLAIVVATRTRLHPLWVMVIGAFLGMTGVGQ
ncbi:MAG: chromate transporter [Betaproteobacteria bacterium]|nr:chromate transporter [Betaproteobacteria bacterium]